MINKKSDKDKIKYIKTEVVTIKRRRNRLDEKQGRTQKVDSSTHKSRDLQPKPRKNIEGTKRNRTSTKEIDELTLYPI